MAERILELLIKYVGAPLALAFGLVIVIAGAGFAYAQFAGNITLSLKKPFLEKQLDYCIQAANAVAVVSTAEDTEIRSKKVSEFYQLYYGPLVLFENESVAGAMVAFRKDLERQADRHELQSSALKVSSACRDLIASQWRIGLSTIGINLR